MKKIITAVIVTLSLIASTYAAPIFGKPGQGTPNFNGQNMECLSGWHWCAINYMEKLNLDIRNYLAIDAEESGDGTISVTMPVEYVRSTFAKMFSKNVFTISYPASFDEKISELLSQKLKLKPGTILYLKNGSYPVKIVKDQIVISRVIVGNISELKAKGWDGKIMGKMKVTDGILNGKKTMLNSDEVIKLLSPVILPGATLSSNLISADKNAANLIIEVVLKDQKKQVITVKLGTDETGYLIIEGTASEITTMWGKTITSTNKIVLYKKHDYVGHVTLLK